MSESPARIAELLCLYRRTHYRVALADGSLKTLRIGAMPPPAVADWIGVDGFALYLTASNPYSRLLADEENRARETDLDERLRDAGARLLAGSASIPGESWVESSRLVTDVGLCALDALARDFHQNASVLVSVGEIVRLRLYRREWVSPPLADAEWISRGT